MHIEGGIEMKRVYLFLFCYILFCLTACSGPSEEEQALRDAIADRVSAVREAADEYEANNNY